MSVDAFYLGTGDSRVFAVLHAAAAPRGAAVLLCAPFGWDEIGSYRPRRDWAVRLAAAGHTTLRFDLPGAGDSAGGPGDEGLVERWQEAVTAAASELRELSGCDRVAAVGIGLGGLVALAAAAAGAPIDDVVLWGTPARGRTLVRELRAFSRLQAVGQTDLTSVLDDGSLSAGGFVLSAATLAALEALDLRALELPPAPGRRALLLDRDGIAPDASLEQWLRDAGVEVAVAPGEGFGQLTLPPDESRLPQATCTRVLEWLGGAAGPTRAPATLPAAGTLELDGAVERPVELDVGGTAIFGVLAEPESGPAPLTAVLLNAGGVRRVGPNRMWVELARRWARRGIPTFRVDLQGIGDADGESEQYADFRRLYVPAFVEQVRATLDALEAQGLPARFVLVGLCSGAYWAFQTLLDDDRVEAAFMVNPRLLFVAEDLHAERDSRRVARRALDARAWWRLLRGRTDMSPRRVLAAIGWTAAARLGRAERLAPGRLTETLGRADATGRRSYLLFCDGEPLRDELEREGLLESGRFANVEIELMPGVDHTLRPLVLQRRAHAALDRALERIAATTRA